MRFWNSFSKGPKKKTRFLNPFEACLKRETNLMQACLANQHEVIMPSWLPKVPSWLRKNAHCLSQSAFSNFAPYVIIVVKSITTFRCRWSTLRAAWRSCYGVPPWFFVGERVSVPYLEERLSDNGLIPSFYKRYVDDTLAMTPGLDTAECFLDVLNALHPSILFTMELSNNVSIPFIGTLITKNGNKLETQVYRKSTNTGLVLHFQSHTDLRYKKCLIKTMHYGLSCKRVALYASSIRRVDECSHLKCMFHHLGYPSSLVNCIIDICDYFSTLCMLCRVALGTQIVEQRITLKCKLKCYLNPWITHWALALVKRNREPHEDLGGNRTHDLRIRSIVTLPTELQGRTEKVGDDFRWWIAAKRK